MEASSSTMCTSALSLGACCMPPILYPHCYGVVSTNGNLPGITPTYRSRETAYRSQQKVEWWRQLSLRLPPRRERRSKKRPFAHHGSNLDPVTEHFERAANDAGVTYIDPDFAAFAATTDQDAPTGRRVPYGVGQQIAENATEQHGIAH